MGKDVAGALGYERETKAIVDRVDEEDRKMVGGKTQSQTGTELGQRGGWLINESGLYSLILSSKLPAAKKFKRWVTTEVLPSIRKTGAYMTEETIEKVLINPDTVIELAQQIKSLRASVKDREDRIKELKPKADYTDIILNSKGLVTITQIAKDYGMSGRAMNQLLGSLGVQYKRHDQWVLYSKYQSKGYAHSKTIGVGAPGCVKAVMTTHWTQLGRMFIYELLKKRGVHPVVEQEEFAACI